MSPRYVFIYKKTGFLFVASIFFLTFAPMVKQTDIFLIDSMRQDSPKAFDILFERYSKELYAYSLQFTKSAEEAEEIVHDVFLCLWTNRKRLKSVDSLRPLLFQMSKYRLINAFRARVGSPVFEEYVELMDKRADVSHLPLEYEELVSQIRHYLSLLPRQQKLIVEMAKLEELTPAEIAIKLDISVQTVRNQLSTGMKKLRELLSDTILLVVLFFIK